MTTNMIRLTQKGKFEVFTITVMRASDIRMRGLMRSRPQALSLRVRLSSVASWDSHYTVDSLH